MDFLIMRYKVLIFGCLLFFGACKEETDDSSRIDGREYYNSKTGSWIVYKVDSIVFSDFNPSVQIVDSYSYQAKEILTEKFTDINGKENNRIERFIRKSDTLPWIISNVWTSVISNENLQKVEENIRYVKLSFPVYNDKVWPGNALNNLDPNDYTYKNVKSPATINGIFFQNCLTVIQKDSGESNLVKKQFAREIYAEGIGMVLRQVDTLEIQSNLKKGLYFRQTVIDWSK